MGKIVALENALVYFGLNIDRILAINEDAWHFYSKLFVDIFPRGQKEVQTTRWGWSRVGWSWVSWWKYVEKCIVSLETSIAFNVVVDILCLIQEKEGTTLAEMPAAWSRGDKMKQVISKLCYLAGS